MLDLNKLDEKQKEQYVRLVGPAITTNNIAKNCHAILVNDISLINNEIHNEIAKRLATAVDCLKNCFELNDNFIEKTTDKFIKEYEEKDKSEDKSEDKKQHEKDKPKDKEKCDCSIPDPFKNEKNTKKMC